MTDNLRFSQRMGLTPIKVDLQIDSMDDALRNSLWSFYFNYKEFLDDSMNYRYQDLYDSLKINFFKIPIDNDIDIRGWFFSCNWYEKYDFIEFILSENSIQELEDFKKECNSILERELSAYRLIADKITPITNEREIKEIEEAIEKSKITKLSGVHAHLKTALTLFSDRKSPDYRNSIKESISAVEAISILISGNPKASLADALNILENKIDLHGALKKGFQNIYGYTSDEGGIRHSLTEESQEVDFDDAKYMLVSCSAFVNYLIGKAQKAGIIQ
jgi:hypothetical protein